MIPKKQKNIRKCDDKSLGRQILPHLKDKREFYLLFFTICLIISPAFAMDQSNFYKTIDITVHDDGSYQLTLGMKHIFVRDNIEYNMFDVLEKLSPGSSGRSANYAEQFLREVVDYRQMEGVVVARSFISNGASYVVVDVDSDANTQDGAALPRIKKTQNGFDIYFPMGTWTGSDDSELAKKIYAAGASATDIDTRVFWTITYNFPSSGSVSADISPTSTTSNSATWKTESSQYTSVRIPTRISFTRGIGIPTDTATVVGIGAVVVGGGLAALKFGGVLGGAKAGTAGSGTASSGTSQRNTPSPNVKTTNPTHSPTSNTRSTPAISDYSSGYPQTYQPDTAESWQDSAPDYSPQETSMDFESAWDLSLPEVNSVDLLTTVPKVNEAVDYVAHLSNPTSFIQNVTVQPLARDAAGMSIPIEPFNVTIPPGEMLDTAFQFIPKKHGDYNIEISTMTNGMPGASFIGRTLTVEGTSFEIISSGTGSTEFSPGKEMPVQVSVVNTGNNEITVDASAVLLQNGEPILEVYLWEGTIPLGSQTKISGRITAPEKEGRYDLEVVVRSGGEERRSQSTLIVKSGAEVSVLGIPDHVSAGERFTLHVEVTNRGRARSYTLVVTGNGIDEVTRQVSLGPNERKIVAVDARATRTMRKGDCILQARIFSDGEK